jgi:hypothetical protein
MLRERTSPIIVICCTGLMTELILSWVVIWLSDRFFFDIPGWSLWLLFSGPLALSLAAVLIHLTLRSWLKQPPRAWGHELYGRYPEFRGLQGGAGDLGPDRETTDW